MGASTRYLDRRVYPRHHDNWDDQILREAILEVVEPTARCLDYGAGRGYVRQLDFRDKAAYIAGIDPDPAVLRNPYLDNARVLDLATNRIEYPDESFDLIFSDNVLEHLVDPDRVFAELFRVLRPGGRFIAKTPNACHYMPLISRLSPHWFHCFYNKLRGRPTANTYPTHYRANSKKTIERLAVRHGFEVATVRRIEGRPEYLRISLPTYLAGIAYEKLVNSSERLAFARSVLLVELTRPVRQGKIQGWRHPRRRSSGPAKPGTLTPVSGTGRWAKGITSSRS